MVATLLLGNWRFVQWVHLKASDFHFLVRGKRPVSNIVIIALDQLRQDLEGLRPQPNFFAVPAKESALQVEGKVGE
jgi:hypothetical protein